MAQYREPVNGVGVKDLPQRMQHAMAAVEQMMPPRTGIIVFTFDFGAGGGMSYIANGDREGCIAALKEWIAHQEQR